MSTQPINMHLYRLLLKIGANESEAENAARLDASDLVTKADLAAFEARLAWTIGAINAGSMVALTAIFALIVGWLQRGAAP
jgi:hypothetical protein